MKHNIFDNANPENPYTELLLSIQNIPKHFVAIANTYKALPFTWSDSKHYLCPASKKSLQKIRLRLALAYIYFLTLCIQAYTSWSRIDFSTQIFIICVYSCCVLGFVLLYANLKHRVLICNLTSALHAYNKTLVQILPLADCMAALKTFKALYKFQCLLAFCIGMPFISHVSIIATPCIPVFFGNWLLSECSTQ